MLKLSLLSILSFMQIGSTVGIWVDTQGNQIEAPCPDVLEYADRVRLPAGCTVELPGVWLASSRYKSMEVKLAEQAHEVALQAEYIRVLKAQLKQAQDSLLVCTSTPIPPPCKSNKVGDAVGAAFIGAALTAGGCALWQKLN